MNIRNDFYIRKKRNERENLNELKREFYDEIKSVVE